MEAKHGPALHPEDPRDGVSSNDEYHDIDMIGVDGIIEGQHDNSDAPMDDEHFDDGMIDLVSSQASLLSGSINTDRTWKATI